MLGEFEPVVQHETVVVLAVGTIGDRSVHEIPRIIEDDIIGVPQLL
jgi:hypothetical protein